jgi:hypothetical protein
MRCHRSKASAMNSLAVSSLRPLASSISLSIGVRGTEMPRSRAQLLTYSGVRAQSVTQSAKFGIWKA